jgi:hypothetical protein
METRQDRVRRLVLVGVLAREYAGLLPKAQPTSTGICEAVDLRRRGPTSLAVAVHCHLPSRRSDNTRTILEVLGTTDSRNRDRCICFCKIAQIKFTARSVFAVLIKLTVVWVARAIIVRRPNTTYG